MNTTREILIHEARSLASALGKIEFRESPNNEEGPVVRVIGGYIPSKHALEQIVKDVGWQAWFAAKALLSVYVENEQLLHRYFYIALRNYLVAEGFRVMISQVGGSRRDIHKSVPELDNEIAEEYDEDTPVIEVGHSLGGVLAIARKILSPHADTISHIVTLGTPLLGTPLVPLERLVRRETGADLSLYQKYRQRIAEVSGCITMISSDADLIAPPGRCTVEKTARTKSSAKHINLSREIRGSHIPHSELVLDKRVFPFIVKEIRG